MKILILAAMDKEVNLLSNLIQNLEEFKHQDLKCFRGIYENKKIIIAKCGIGKVNAALNAYRLISEFNPDIVINSGVAAGVNLKIGSILVADKVAYHDVWCGPGTQRGQADGLNLFMFPSEEILKICKEKADIFNPVFGLLCSGDKFISTHSEVNEIQSIFPDVKAIDMESASIAHACWLTGTPFGIIRIISDLPDEGNNIEQYQNFWKIAPERNFNILKLLINNL